MNIENIYRANRLIYFSLAYSYGKKGIVSQNQSETAELLQQFQAEDEFRTMVKEGLRAMELQLLALEDKGLRLSSLNADSLFAMNVTDYGKLLARSDLKSADILCIHCAIATAFFPSEEDLDAPVEDLGVITAGDVIDILRRFAHAESTMDESDDLFHPQVRTVAQRLRELPEENPDIKRVGRGHSWKELADHVLKHMVETEYLLAFEEQSGEREYRPTPAYQTAIREGMVYTFHAFRDFLSEQNENKKKDNSDVPSL